MTDAAPPTHRRASLRTKLSTTILLAGLLPLVLASVTSYVLARGALVRSAERRLSIMRDEEKRQLVESFEDVARTVRLLAVAPTLRVAAVALADGFARLPEDLGWSKAGTDAADTAAARLRDDALRALSRLHAEAAGAGGASDGAPTLPSSPQAQAAQVLFLSENPHPVGAKHLLERPTRAGTAYGDAHERIHAYAAAIVRECELDDLCVVDARTGDVVYAFAKRLDFGGNVREGTVAATGLGRAARRALDANASDTVCAEDFELYGPAGGRPVAFVASPVRTDGRTVAALVALVGGARIARVAAAESGVAASTETYLVGPDRRMRSDSPFAAESTFLRKTLDSVAVRESLAGNTGVEQVDDYRGVPSLVAYAPLELLGLRYGIVRKVDEAEELAPVRTLLAWMCAIVLALIVVAIVAARLLSRSLSRPIQAVTARLQTTAQSLLSTAQQQQAGAAESAAAVEETRQTFTGVLGAAHSLRKVGTEVLGNAEVSQRNAQTINRRIQELSESTARIGEMLTLVREIANRSDLLALNAALEGTKAGEAGRGFSLVATQMQRLAEEVMGSVKKIEGLTQEISRSSAGAVLAAEEADKASTRTTASAHEIAEAVQTQQTATEQVSVAMNEIATVARGSVDAARTIVTSSNDLLGVADELRRVMGDRA